MLDRLLERLRPLRVDCSVLTRPVTIEYLTGLSIDPHERLMALVTRERGSALLVPALEREKAATSLRGTEVIAWEDGQDSFWALANLVGTGRRIGVEKAHITLYAAERLLELTAGAELVDVGSEVARLRSRKSPGELEKLQEAARLTDAVTAVALEELRPGMTELEVAKLVERAMTERGTSAAFGSAVQFGPNSAMPHHGPSDRRLEKGDLVLLDIGATAGGYCGDITRMAVVGEPDPRHSELHGVVLEAHDRAIDAVRAGATAGAVDAAAREVIAKAGLGDRFIHRVGHGLGLEAHEHPSLSPHSDVVLEEGMVVTIEPGVYIPGWGGIRIEDDLVVESDGARVLTSSPRELRVVG